MNDYDRKYLKKVIINADVYATCLQHALSTEKEEVMGLLIGNVNEEEKISHISACKILRRVDKQPDRVEISPEQLMDAASYAEALTQQLKKQMRVTGWYHSHPHITVLPSHLDVRTQALYQMMDAYFVGLIFSVYPKNSGSNDNQIQITAFQSVTVDNEPQRVEVKLEIVYSKLEVYNLEALSTLPKILLQEEVENQPPEEKSDDPLVQLHNDSLKLMRRVHIMTKVTRPICDHLEERLKTLKFRIAELKALKMKLKSELE